MGDVAVKRGQVSISGVANVEIAARLAEALREALASGKPVTVDIAALEHADASIAQVLIAAAQSARSAGITFTITGDLDPVLTAVGGSPDLRVLLGRD